MRSSRDDDSGEGSEGEVDDEDGGAQPIRGGRAGPYTPNNRGQQGRNSMSGVDAFLRKFGLGGSPKSGPGSRGAMSEPPTPRREVF